MKTATERLQEIVSKLERVVDEGQGILNRVGQTVGELQRAGEKAHMDNLEREGGRLWQAALLDAAEICRTKRIFQSDLREAYAQGGLFKAQMQGAYEVAESIWKGFSENNDDYYPIRHLSGMLSALQFVLNQ